MNNTYTFVDWRNSDHLDYQDDLDIFLDNLKRVIDKSEFGLTANGTVGCWDGTFRGGAYIDDISDVYKLINRCEITATIEKGRLFIEASHHDGNNLFELRRVTNRGYDRVLNTQYACGYSKVDYAEFLCKSKYYTRRCCKSKSELELFFSW